MKVWQSAPPPGPEAARLAGETGLPGAVAEVLIARRIRTAEDVARFLSPRLHDLADPLEIPDMEAAARRIRSAIQNAEPIVVFGDYDVDGITATALLTGVLRRLGARVAPFLPHREDDGYGLHPATLERCLNLHQPALLVTVDCGTGSVEAARLAAERGVDLIITDHHELPGELAPALAVVNPKRGHPAAPWQDLCGVGVAFKLCHALLRECRDAQLPDAAALDLRGVLDLVALGTIADVVPLTGENRTLARHGLTRLQRTANPGLQELMRVSGVRGPLEPYHVGFMLAPRINAAGRLGAAEQALELLLTQDSGRAGQIAQELDNANRERRTIENDAYRIAEQQTLERFDPEQVFGIVAVGQNWHPGVIGIVASRLTERFHRPSIVITTQRDGRIRGSCRSIEGFHLVEALAECSTLLQRHGGHAMAAGIELEPRHVEAFRDRFNEVAAGRLQGRDLRPRLNVDGWLRLGDIDDALLNAMEQMQPFGVGHAEPVWAARGVALAASPRAVGERHLKLRLRDNDSTMDAIAFRMSERDLPPAPFDVAFTAKRHTWNDRTEVQLTVKDIRPTPNEAGIGD